MNINYFKLTCVLTCVLCLGVALWSVVTIQNITASCVDTNENVGNVIHELPATFNSYKDLYEFAQKQTPDTQLTNITCKGSKLSILIRDISGGDCFEELSIHTWDGTRSLFGSTNGYKRILYIPFRNCFFSVEKTEKDTVRIFEHMGSSSNRRIVFEIYNAVGSNWYRDDFIKNGKPLKDKSLYRMHPVLLPSLPLRKKTGAK